jgi:hypothetical protein
VTPSTMFLLPLRGEMFAHWSTLVSLQSDRSRCFSCSRHYRYDCGEMLE